MEEGVYHLEVTTIKRSEGRSAPGASAYRSGTVQIDERTGETFDYRRKSGVMFSEITLPPGAPAQYQDRAVLWNKAEEKETRKNSVVAREIVVAIPFDLTRIQQIALIKTFVAELVSKHQIAIDWNLHTPHEKGSKNVHAHLLMSTRRLSEAGFHEKSREWDDVKTGTVDSTRALWADLVNDAYKTAGKAKFIDHRSHKTRGLDVEPTVKMGVAATGMEKRGEDSELGNKNRAIRAANALIDKAKRDHAFIHEQIQELVNAPQIEATTNAQITTPTVQTAELPTPQYENFLAGPGATQTAARNPDQTPHEKAAQPTRAEKEAEYHALLALQEKAKDYGRFSEAFNVAFRSFEDKRSRLEKKRPPPFATVLKSIGLNRRYDDYIEEKNSEQMTLKEEGLRLKSLREKVANLKLSSDMWDRTGWARHKALAKELGFDKPVQAPQIPRNDAATATISLDLNTPMK